VTALRRIGLVTVHGVPWVCYATCGAHPTPPSPTTVRPRQLARSSLVHHGVDARPPPTRGAEAGYAQARAVPDPVCRMKAVRAIGPEHSATAGE
jgi:hypothetical protein